MADDSETKSIRVHVMGREYALRVREEDEAFTRKVASFVNERMEQFRDEHPEQAELTTAVVTALALAEELHTQEEERADDAGALNEKLDRLSGRLEAVLSGSGSGGP
ncbi:MAG: cell division protein ZapA [Bacteroidetes bacterium QH_7_62_13]|jgi:cell division protein ZapA|nr:MAG: cell division protein ZapA [Bacteroidetes bacterium QH_1_61_8]PSQ76956.1 MAG: cell division protein ZapA [Bacteroidetes bacterium QH_7_62_13]